MDSDPLAIPVKKGEILFLLMRSRKAALKKEYYVEGEMSKSDIVYMCLCFGYLVFLWA